MFDEIYWSFIDQRFFGHLTTIDDRLCLLSAEERVDIDTFVEKKMHQTRAGNLDSHYSIDELVDL